MEVTAAQSISGCGPITNNPNNPIAVNLSLKPSKSVKIRCRNWSSTQSARGNHANFTRSDSPARLMQWTNGAWLSLASEVLSVSKSAFSERKAVVDLVIDGKSYVIDFYRMLLIDFSSGFRRSIAWIDVNNNCYFPRAFIDDDVDDDDDDDDENNLQIKIEVKLDNNSCNRKLEEKDEVDTAGSTCVDSAIGTTKRQRVGDVAMSKGVNFRVLNDVAGGDVAMSKGVNLRVLNDVAKGVNVRALGEEEVDTVVIKSEVIVNENTKWQPFIDVADGEGVKGVDVRILSDVAGSEVAKGVNVRVLSDVAGGEVAKGVNVRVFSDVAEGEVVKEGKVRVLSDVASGEVVKEGKIRVLSEEDKSYTAVRELFMTGMRNADAGVRVSKIHQFVRGGAGMGGVEKARFWKQMEMVKGARGKANVVFAWCGMSQMGVREVLDCGFVSSRVSGNLGHGGGFYFSPARFSHQSDSLSEVDDNGEKHVLLCCVILGNIEKVAAGSQQCHPSSVNFDSGTDDLVNPKWYIVWTKNMNTHVLPEFVVSYKCSENYQGQQPKASEVMDWIPVGSGSVVTKLFSKLDSCLPASKVDVLRALCMAFKTRRIPKDKFLKQLKFVVGDEVLRSVISEIQCAN